MIEEIKRLPVYKEYMQNINGAHWDLETISRKKVLEILDKYNNQEEYKWKCDICGNGFNNFHAQGFDNQIYCPLCYYKKLYSDYKKAWKELYSEKEMPCSIEYMQELENKHSIGSDDND